MFRMTVLDDAGKRVPLVYVGVWFPFRGVGPIPYAIQRTIEPALRSRYRHSTKVYLASAYPYIGLGVQILGCMFLQTSIVEQPLYYAVQMVGIGLGTVATILALQYVFGARLMPSKAREIVARTVVNANCCGSCGYPLVESVLAARADGKVDCPECGATWS